MGPRKRRRVRRAAQDFAEALQEFGDAFQDAANALADDLDTAGSSSLDGAATQDDVKENDDASG